MLKENNKYLQYIHELNQIGIALSAEKDHQKLLEKILHSAIDMVHADGGTLYLAKQDKLIFEILINKSLNLTWQSNNKLTKMPPIQLYDHGKPNKESIAAYCYLENKTIHIQDAYQYDNFNFSGMKKFDEQFDYHSTSFLVIPLRNHENKILGILQLINALDDETGRVIPFSYEKINIAESLASQAAIILTQHDLIETQKKLFNALRELIAKTIDEKSKYTSKHCSRVPVLTLKIAEAAQQSTEDVFKDFKLSEDELEELRMTAWLHDCDKIVTPRNIVNKSTKLEEISDRIEVLELRIELLLRDAKIALLENNMTRQQFHHTVRFLEDARLFLKKVNMGNEFITEVDLNRIILLSKQSFAIKDTVHPLLKDKDIENLSISRGTLK